MDRIIPGAPDLCWARKPNVKEGIGAFAEQYIGHDIGVFARGMYSDGKTEVYAYTSTDRSATVGVLAKGFRVVAPQGRRGHWRQLRMDLGYSREIPREWAA